MCDWMKSKWVVWIMNETRHMQCTGTVIIIDKHAVQTIIRHFLYVLVFCRLLWRDKKIVWFKWCDVDSSNKRVYAAHEVMWALKKPPPCHLCVLASVRALWRSGGFIRHDFANSVKQFRSQRFQWPVFIVIYVHIQCNDALHRLNLICLRSNLIC